MILRLVINDEEGAGESSGSEAVNLVLGTKPKMDIADEEHEFRCDTLLEIANVLCYNTGGSGIYAQAESR